MASSEGRLCSVHRGRLSWRRLAGSRQLTLSLCHPHCSRPSSLLPLSLTMDLTCTGSGLRFPRLCLECVSLCFPRSRRSSLYNIPSAVSPPDKLRVTASMPDFGAAVSGQPSADLAPEEAAPRTLKRLNDFIMVRVHVSLGFQRPHPVFMPRYCSSTLRSRNHLESQLTAELFAKQSCSARRTSVCRSPRRRSAP